MNALRTEAVYLAYQLIPGPVLGTAKALRNANPRVNISSCHILLSRKKESKICVPCSVGRLYGAGERVWGTQEDSDVAREGVMPGN